MDGPVTYEFIGALGGSLLAVGGVWVYLHNQIASIRNTLNEFKLEVAKEYVSNAHLNEVEKRLIDSIGELSNDIKSLGKEIRSQSRSQ